MQFARYATHAIANDGIRLAHMLPPIPLGQSFHPALTSVPERDKQVIWFHPTAISGTTLSAMPTNRYDGTKSPTFSYTRSHPSTVRSPYVHFGSENRHGKDCLTTIGCHVVRLCALMSYNYSTSCRTFIAPHVVRHDTIIKTALLRTPKT